MIKGVDHVALVTTDVERAATFYTGVLGLQEMARLETSHSGTLIFVGVGETTIELFGGGKVKASGEGNEVGFKHICLLVDDVDAEHARLKARGVAFDMEPATVESGLRICFLRDPDGNRVELMQRPR